MAKCVGIVGLGLMGQAMSPTLLEAGFKVVGYDVLEAQVKAAGAKGVLGLSSPMEVAREADVVISSLPNSDVVEEVHLGPEGTCHGAHEGLILIDTSTISPEAARSIGSRLAERGLPFLDAPISGTSSMVARRDCIVMVGGGEEVFERCRDVLEAIGKKVFYVGPSGAGTQLKLIANHLVGTVTVALAEAFSLGLKAGIDPELMLEVLRPSASGSKMMDVRGPLMARGYFEAQMKVDMFLKDFRLIIGNGQSLGVPLPMASLAQQVATAAGSMGYGSEDLASVIKVFEEMADIKR